MKREGRIQTESRGNWGQQDIQGWPLPGPFGFRPPPPPTEATAHPPPDNPLAKVGSKVAHKNLARSKQEGTP